MGIEKIESISNLDAEVENVSSNTMGNSTDLRRVTTKRGLKSRHAQMIALGGTIGTGLFVGSGRALNMGGPVTLVIVYLLLTLLVFGIVTATTEMSSYIPVPGSSMSYYGFRFFSPSMGFAMGWMYWYIFSITVPAEITISSLIIEYWDPPVHKAVWLTLIGLIIIVLNCFPVKVYGETEFWFASLKVISILGLLVMAVCLVLGGGPKSDRLGFRYWTDPQPVNEYLFTGSIGRLCAFLGTLIFSMFAFAFAPELLVVTGGEMESPRRNLPVAGKRYFYRLVIFYCLGALAISMILPSNSPGLLNGTSSSASSPWAIAAERAGIKTLPSIINAVILVSAWSAGNSYLYIASRTLYSMALVGNAPKIFTRCSKSGVPYYALAASASFSLLSYLNLSSTGSTVFSWFVNLINTCGFQSWILVCIIYYYFRKATFAQGVTDLPYRSRFQPYISYISGTVFTFLLFFNGFAIFTKGNWNTSTFIASYAGIPIFLLFYFGHKFTAGKNDPWIIPSEEVDLYTGLDEVLASETPAPPPEKWYMKWKAVYQ
ncbi:hypothetical protein VE02_06433 [Pseudogymnoascus sp. 03VT05]|nr:hypothetical protein VE02_06433 [Pseudogymnoascus sp. 03VT05]